MTRAIAVLALAVLAAACGSPSQAISPSPSPSPVQNGASPSAGVLVFSIDGKKYGTSAVGTITLTHQQKPFMLEVKIHGLAADSQHVSHIHGGSCQQPGGIIFGLNLVVADATGIADTRTQVNASYPPASGHWYVVVHAGADMQGPNANYLMCGNLF